MSRVVRACAAAVVGAACLLIPAAPAPAAIDAGLFTTCSSQAPASGYSFFFCDDGVPAQGGTTANVGGVDAITVPAKYQGADSFTGLPPQALDALTVPGNSLGQVALDVDVSIPSTAPPGGGYPLIVLMHGCCSGDKKSWESTSFDAAGEGWHYNNAWFASRGYMVVNYTARGFVDNQNHGSTGETQLDSRSYEINDFQDLACQVAANASSWAGAVGHAVAVNPANVVVTGGSYGGALAWLALTDPLWNCATEGSPALNMSLSAAAPRYGWTDLVYSLVPTGTHFGEPDRLPEPNGCSSGPNQPDGSGCPAPQTPLGLPKRSILNVLYGSGAIGLPPNFSHTTFPASIAQAFACLSGPDLGEGSPLCTGIAATLAEFLRERSAYYQNGYFQHLVNGDAGYTVPIFNAATFTDPLFTSIENRRMINRLRSINASYPVQSYYGDYQHFVQNKAKVWGDTCGGDQHVCAVSEYPGSPADLNVDPAGLVRRGVTTRLNRFIDFYAQPSANPSPPAPVFDVTAELQVCPGATPPGTEDRGGEQFVAPTFEQLAPNTLTVNATGAQTTTNKAAPNAHAASSDPLGNLLQNDGACPLAPGPAGPGVASYTSSALGSNFTMLGGSTVTVTFAATGPVSQMNLRLYDVLPDGTALMVDRGPRRLFSSEVSSGAVTFQIHGNGWRFPAGHRVRVELAQDDDPFVHETETPSSASLSRAVLRIPIREPSATINAKPTLRKGRCANKTVGTKLGERLIGSPKGDRIRGGRGRDLILGRAGKDCLFGEGGPDRVSGGSGRDKLSGGPKKDKLSGGSGPDRILARDHKRDVVRCGKGKDRAVVDRVDRVKGCEKVKGK